MENEFGVKENDDSLDFTNAKTVVMFCNGMWCGQSPNNIRNLLKLGYPADKIKWYRGGMQDWEILGLTTVPGK
jgi:rhodanese-related sulfurtransferase